MGGAWSKKKRGGEEIFWAGAWDGEKAEGGMIGKAKNMQFYRKITPFYLVIQGLEGSVKVARKLDF